MKKYEKSLLYLFLFIIALILNNSVLYQYKIAKIILALMYLVFIIKIRFVYLELKKSDGQ